MDQQQLPLDQEPAPYIKPIPKKIKIGLRIAMAGIITFTIFAGFLMISSDAPREILEQKIMLGISVLILGLLCVSLAQVKASGTRHKPNYKALFILGVIFTIVGIGSENYMMWPIGLALVIFGLLRKNKWK
ncbi:MAG: hypothetical protein QF809_03730 [Candidatus Peribacteraceae bacterium]|jgi:hypothetical protein|nr:hypothetical protein [Candidatus Peribacteraceae bacterium]MDP7645868.1 hypothetical protein [Candidatus Peribacteraceae bacterium]|tara:strand:- start:2333 stop:2725 length:393 start_codon:yes stop_codon:yes gene_type:complete